MAAKKKSNTTKNRAASSKKTGAKKSNTRKKTTNKKKQAKNKSVFSFLIKFIFIAGFLGGLSYVAFFVKVEGVTPYKRISKMINSKNNSTASSDKKAKERLGLAKVKANTKKRVDKKERKISKVRKKRQNHILKAKTRDRKIEKKTVTKIATRKKTVDFVNSKSISKKEKDSLNNLINSNL